MSKPTTISRRVFIQRSALAGAGLTLGVNLVGCGQQSDETQTAAGTAIPDDLNPVEANAFVKIGRDNKVTVLIKHTEFGQGTFTGLATLVAEEMDADWEQIISELAPLNAKLYGNSMFGGAQATGGSTSIASSFTVMREAGAAARQMLLNAAAQLWQVDAAEISVNKGIVSHSPSSNQATFGELADAASQQPVPEQVALKSPENFTLIGQNIPRKDSGKTDGSAIFTQDIQFPGMLTAVVAHAPMFGATLKSVDDSAARQIPGVVDVTTIPTGVAVVAETFWQAKKGRDALILQWDNSEAFQQSSDEIMAEYRELSKQPGLQAKQVGDVDEGFAKASKIVEASYEFPYLAHATMEPMNCVAKVSAESAELWYGSQGPSADQLMVAETLGLAPEKVTIHSLLAGGSFGRRSNSIADYVVEAALIAKSQGPDVPVKLVWTREDDNQAGHYRPMYFHQLKAGLDDTGKIVAWQHHIVGQSIMLSSRYAAMVQNGIDRSSVEGAINPPYKIDNFSVQVTNADKPVSVLWWRSVGSTHTGYSTEAFIDELAAAAGEDPVSFRRKQLIGDPRYLGVIDLAVEKSGWNTPAPEGRVRGFAVHKSFGTYVAQVAELSIDDNNQYRVEKVTCAVDCGIAVNPDVIKAQMEGGIGFGLSPTLMSELTLEKGDVVEKNFDRYQVIRLKDMPQIDVHIVPSAEPPRGVGEPSTPVIGPAVANALFAATGKARHKLPIGQTV